MRVRLLVATRWRSGVGLIVCLVTLLGGGKAQPHDAGELGSGLRTPYPLQTATRIPGRLGESAVMHPSRSGAWEDPRCLVRRGCPTRVRPLPACAPKAARSGSGALTVRTWTELEPQAEKFSGTVVRVRGPLGVGPLGEKGPSCRTKKGQRACCGATFADILLGGGAHANLALQGLKCGGDESLTCCNAPAYGQNVIASGRLIPVRGAVWNMPHWTLAKPKLCAE